MRIKVFVDGIEVTSLRVEKKVAAALLDCNLKTFEEQFVNSGLLTPDPDFGDGRSEFWVQDIILVYKKRKEKPIQNHSNKSLYAKDPSLADSFKKPIILVGRKKWELTPRMKQVHDLVEQGYKSKEIALMLGLTAGTIQFIRSGINSRLKLQKRLQKMMGVSI
jgi:DNA-binding CsgD family transcriptional regulator